MGDHGRYDELAVGHVLGGLPQDDAAEFRGHLLGCRDCRRRVAELRDIADDLAAAERDERQQARIKTEVVRRADAEAGDHDGSEEDDRPGRHTPAPRTVAWWTIGLLLVALTLGLWSFHLRTVNAELLATAERQQEVMELLAAGTTVATTFAGAVQGRVAKTADRVALTLVGVPEPTPDRRLVIWLVSGDDVEPVLVGRRAGAEGRVAWAGDLGEADRLLVTIEPWPATGPDVRPVGTVVAEADLTVPTVARNPDGEQPRRSFVGGARPADAAAGV